MLNISVRGLQKKLNKHERSFSHIANLARRELAKIYLIQKQQSIDFTAEQLGFQTSSGFRRFFKTEFEMSPAEFLNVSGIMNNTL
jgi:AraC-like DNA-binding protein